MERNKYHFRPLHVRLIPQVLLEVEAVHVLIDETERVCLSRVHANERYYVHIFVKEAVHMNLVVKPLCGDVRRVPPGMGCNQHTATT